MTEKKGLGGKLLGFFVETDEEKPKAPPPAIEPEAEEPPAPAPAPPPVELKGPLPVPAAGGIELGAVFKAAGISPEAQGRVEKAMTLLGTLPADAPGEVKRQIVEASLKAFGYPVEQIVEAGSAELRALQAFVELTQRNSTKLIAEAEVRIEELNRQIAELRAETDQKVAGQRQLAEQCTQAMAPIQGVLDFFGGR